MTAQLFEIPAFLPGPQAGLTGSRSVKAVSGRTPEVPMAAAVRAAQQRLNDPLS
jgi:hypothetical protein